MPGEGLTAALGSIRGFVEKFLGDARSLLGSKRRRDDEDDENVVVESDTAILHLNREGSSIRVVTLDHPGPTREARPSITTVNEPAKKRARVEQSQPVPTNTTPAQSGLNTALVMTPKTGENRSAQRVPMTPDWAISLRTGRSGATPPVVTVRTGTPTLNKNPSGIKSPVLGAYTPSVRSLGGSPHLASMSPPAVPFPFSIHTPYTPRHKTPQPSAAPPAPFSAARAATPKTFTPKPVTPTSGTLFRGFTPGGSTPKSPGGSGGMFGGSTTPGGSTPKSTTPAGPHTAAKESTPLFARKSVQNLEDPDYAAALIKLGGPTIDTLSKVLGDRGMEMLKNMHEEKRKYGSAMEHLEREMQRQEQARMEAVDGRIREKEDALQAMEVEEEEDDEPPYTEDEGGCPKKKWETFRRPEGETRATCPTIPGELRHEIWNKWTEPMPDETILTAYNTVITGEMFQCTMDTQWMNSEVLAVWLSLWGDHVNANPGRYRKTHLFTTFFYGKLTSAPGGHGVGPKYNYAGVRRWTKKVDVFSKSLLLYPVHLGVHWVLFAIDFDRKTLTYYDSMSGGNPKMFEHMRQWLVDEYKDKKGGEFDLSEWTNHTPSDIPQQHNGFDCGFFMLTNARYLCEGRDLDFDQAHFQYIRRRVAGEVLKQKILE